MLIVNGLVEEKNEPENNSLTPPAWVFMQIFLEIPGDWILMGVPSPKTTYGRFQ